MCCNSRNKIGAGLARNSSSIQASWSGPVGPSAETLAWLTFPIPPLLMEFLALRTTDE